MNWQIISEKGISPRKIALKFSKRGVTYLLFFGIYWGSDIQYSNPERPFRVWNSRSLKEKTFTYEEFIKWLSSKQLPIPPLLYKP